MGEQQLETSISSSLLNALVKRRGRRIVIVKSLLDSLKDETSRAELIKTFRRLEAAGCGRFIVGRRNKESRFVWDIEPRRAIEKLKYSTDIKSSSSGLENDRLGVSSEIKIATHTVGKNSINSSVLMHQFPLRPGFVVKLELPQDLSISETTRLVDFIKSMCIDGSRG